MYPTQIQFAIIGEEARRATQGMFLAPPGFPLLGCLAYVKSRGITLIDQVPYFISSAIFFGMTIYKLGQSVTQNRGLIWTLRTRSMRSGLTPICRSFIRGGALCFLIVTVATPICFGISMGENNPFTVSYEPWLYLALSFAGTRLILALRRADTKARQSGEQTVMGMETWEADTNFGHQVLPEPIAFRQTIQS